MNVELSAGEWKLMNQLWQNRPPGTITQLVADLADDTGWSKHTVITMLNRLEAKGAVRHEEGGRAKEYYPAVKRPGWPCGRPRACWTASTAAAWA